MSLDIPDSTSSPLVQQDKATVDSQLNLPASSPGKQSEGRGGEDFPTSNTNTSLKRNEPDDRDVVGDEDRYSKRPKEDDVSWISLKPLYIN